jgi:hypothetical protein
MARIRREALTWLRAVKLNSAEAIWTYQRRYPDGLYAGDADRRLQRLAAPSAPPADFVPVDFPDVPPPLPDEPTTIADIPASPGVPSLLSDPPEDLVGLPAPSPRIGAHVLPVPRLPSVPQFTAGRREPLVSPTGLPGVAGPVATNASQSSRINSNSGFSVASAPPASVALAPTEAVPLPVPAPRPRGASISSPHRLRHSRAEADMPTIVDRFFGGDSAR